MAIVITLDRESALLVLDILKDTVLPFPSGRFQSSREVDKVEDIVQQLEKDVWG